MIRLLALAVLVSLVCRMVFGRWPWDYLEARPSRDQAIVAARRLLDVPHDASEAEIRAAHRRKAAALHPDRGGDTAGIQEINAARDVLLAQRGRSSRSLDDES